MAWHEDTALEIRTTGLSTNGGAFANVTPGISVDYSQQNSSQLALIDIATDAAGTKLTSATGGFTAAMEGNVIYLRGGGAWEGWYQIPPGGYIDTNNVMIDESAGPNKAGVSGDVGGAYKCGVNANRDMILFNRVASHNDVWFGPGTHSPLWTVIFVAGAGRKFGRTRGYKTIRGDNPVSADRPLIDLGPGAVTIQVTSNRTLEHLRATGNQNDVVIVSGVPSFIINVEAHNTQAGANTYAFRCGGGVSGVFIGCEGIADGASPAYAFYMVTGSHCIHCFARDTDRGFGPSGTDCDFCIADNCERGFIVSADIVHLSNCLAYDCTYGYYFSGIQRAAVVNCISDACTWDFYSDQADDQEGIVTLFNCLDGTTKFTHVLDWQGNIQGDPGLRDPANNDFRVDHLDANVYQKALELTGFTSAKV